MVQYHVINDSFHVACQLLSLESKYKPCYQLALDMLKRLGRQDQIVEVLLSKGQVCISVFSSICVEMLMLIIIRLFKH